MHWPRSRSHSPCSANLGTAAGFGIVLAARQGVEVIVLVFGAVLSDRVPRNLVLVGASLVQGAAQAATARRRAHGQRLDLA